MAKKWTDFDYIPSPNDPEPEDKNKVHGTVLGQGTDSTLIRTDKGDIILADKNGVRRG